MKHELLATTPVEHTFLRLPASDIVVSGSASIMGAAHGTAYDSDAAAATEELGPDAVRRAITAASVDVAHWDFDFDGPLLNDGALRVHDLGNILTAPRSDAANREVIEATARHVRSSGSTPILIGGDD